jgi:hypothetical protein
MPLNVIVQVDRTQLYIVISTRHRFWFVLRSSACYVLILAHRATSRNASKYANQTEPRQPMVASRSHTVADLEYAFKSFAVPSPVILREGPDACTLYSLTARPAVSLARDPSQLLLFSYLWTTVLKKTCAPQAMLASILPLVPTPRNGVEDDEFTFTHGCTS